MLTAYAKCLMCPRKCSVDRRIRSDGSFQKGFCGESEKAYLAWAGLHRGEEAMVSGEKGSGMLFFRGCSLGCPTCQNVQISLTGSAGNKADGIRFLQVDDAMLCELAWNMKDMGAHTISFVTAEHFVPLVVLTCAELRKQGFDLPFVFNTSGWICEDSIRDLFPFIDIWLWDTKTHDKAVAAEFFSTAGYPEAESRSFAALISLLDAAGEGKNVIVRHLMVPGHIESTIGVIKDFAIFKDKCLFSLMTQYMDVNGVAPETFDAHCRKVSASEIKRAERALGTHGIERGWIQEPDDGAVDWKPDFTRSNPFPEVFAAPSSLFLRFLAEI